MIEDILTEGEAAHVAHVSTDVIRQWVRRGILTPVHVTDTNPPRRYYHEEDVLHAERETRRHARRWRLLTEARVCPTMTPDTPLPKTG